MSRILPTRSFFCVILKRSVKCDARSLCLKSELVGTKTPFASLVLITPGSRSARPSISSRASFAVFRNILAVNRTRNLNKEHDPISQRALILAPQGRDAFVASRILREAGLVAEICNDLPMLSGELTLGDRKSTRLNSSHLGISYAVFCLKK